MSEVKNEDADAQSVRSVSVRSVRSIGKKDNDEPVPVTKKEKSKSDAQEEPVQISTTEDSYIVKGPAMTEYKKPILQPKSLKVMRTYHLLSLCNSRLIARAPSVQ